MSALSIRTRPTLSRFACANSASAHERLFSATTSNPVSLQIEKNDPEDVASVVPAYPYGPARWYKQSNRGLYGGQKIQFGNNVGETFEVKTRRSWHPNVRTKNLYSRALQRPVQVRVTTRTLRTIDKLGGLDEYLLGEKEARIRELGESGWWLRWAIMQTPTVKKRYAAERQRLGLPKLGEQGSGTAVASAEEVQEAMATGEQVAGDGVFEIESSPTLPSLKFRVGRGAHLVLTPQGWRRTRPGVEWRKESLYRALDEGRGLRRLGKASGRLDTQLARKVRQGEIKLDPAKKRKITLGQVVHDIKRTKLGIARAHIRRGLRRTAESKFVRIEDRRAEKRAKKAEARRNAVAVEEVVEEAVAEA